MAPDVEIMREVASRAVNGVGEEERLRSASRAYRFPYDKAYGIQLDLMRAVFEAIEHRKVGIFESPTGTGKSLSLICGACSWLERNAEREDRSQPEGVDDLIDDVPDWVREHDQKYKVNEKQIKEQELRQRLQHARQRLRSRGTQGKSQIRRINGQTKRTKLDSEVKSNSDDEYMLEAFEDDDQLAKWAGAVSPDDPTSFLSAEVRSLMEQTGAFVGTKKSSTFLHGREEDAESYSVNPKIIFASRTHSQLTQFVGELRKTAFRGDANAVSNSADVAFSVRSISLGSRKQMCINDSVIALGEKAGTEAMNERCLDLMKNNSKSVRCRFLPSLDEVEAGKMSDFQDDLLSDVHDIEDAVTIGRQGSVCPYFGARGAAKQAHMITLPYNLLLNATARASLNLDLKDSIVIVDEAHNLIDTILASHTISLSSEQLQVAIEHVGNYARRFSMRLKGSNEIHLKTFILVLGCMRNHCTTYADSTRPESSIALTSSEYIRKIGGNIDQVNLMNLERWLRSTKIARKVAGYANKVSGDAVAVGKSHQTDSRSKTTSAIHAIEAFLLSLTNAKLDGRIFMSAGGTKECVMLKYQLLNPSTVFDDIVQQARAVILAGGTMEPVSDFETQLFPSVHADGMMHFSCSHIIPPENLFAGIVCAGVKGKKIEFKYDARRDASLLDDLTMLLVNYSNVIPHGVVVFVPSYAFLDALQLHWKTGQAAAHAARISSKKRVFFEPKLATDVDSVLQEYSRQIDGTTTKAGAILFAVVGAKLSEGINFSDRLARAVIMVGMPFANANSPELAERMRYVRQRQIPHEQADAGHELYVNLCMKAVNQSIGRAIRHKDDFAALLFLDHRYARTDIRARLPAWIRDSTKVYETFGPSMAALGQFFRTKRTEEPVA